jgi:TonB family protein
MSSPSALPASFGRYQVLEELGSGAMGVVYLAVDPRLSRPVAIKVMRESEFMTPAERVQFEARFKHEAEAAGRLTHPDIVQIYDVGPSYLVMEFLEGQPLSALLKRGDRPSVRRVIELVRRVADAVDYAHKHGIIHRDIKPANVMLLDDGSVKVMDFGVARLDHSTLTALGTVVGSVRYMAPEQMMGERVDGRADVFSVGAVAYELLTGKAPFPGKTITEVVSRVVHGAHIPPRQADQRLPEALNAVFARAFAPRPADRYALALDFARDLATAAAPALDLMVVARGEPSALPRTEAPVTTVKAAPAPAVPAETIVLEVPPRKAGLLFVETDPQGARVSLNAKAIGVLSVSGREVPFGRHLLRVEKEGHEPVSVLVELTEERPVLAVSLTLPLPPAPGALSRPGFVDLGPEVIAPRRLSGRLPSYPEAARARGLEGSPVADLWVSESGEVLEVAITKSAGPTLDAALREAALGWRFKPATLRGAPISVRLSVQHLFRR